MLLVAGCAASESARQDGAAADTATVVVAPDTLAPPEIPVTVPVTVTNRTPEADAAAEPGRFDLGKMWTFEYPPIEYFREEYDLDVGEAWFERARLGALRMPGCTASFVSPNGLVMTNHHCGRDWVTVVTGASENLLDEGFYASSLEEERPVEGLYMEQLIRIEDVTDEIDAAFEAAQTDAERAQVRAEAIEQIEERLAQEAGDDNVAVEVISLYQGGRYSAYVFRRYEDVRLVMAPELQIAYFGGDYDNFTYPRYALDMTFFRVYEGGEPLDTEYYFPFSENGAQYGEAVFVVGNPGSTYRLETVSLLEFRRDVQERVVLEYIRNRAAAFEEALEVAPSAELRNQLFSLRNAEKAYAGRLEALERETLIERRAAEEEQFEERIAADPDAAGRYGGIIDSLAVVQQEKRELAADYGAFFALAPTAAYSSATLRRALLVYEYLNRLRAGASPESLRPLREQIFSIEEQPRALDERLLAARLREFREYFGETAMITKEVLQGRTPEEQANYVLSNTVVADSAQLARALGSESFDSENDAALLLAQYIYPRLQAYRSAYAGLTARQQELLAQVGRARFEIYGTDIPPDATFSLRIADGVVTGYPFNGTWAPYQTTFYGLYDHYYSYMPKFEAWDLPEQWLTPPEGFDLSTPMNLVSTNDIIGGNSGSPLLNEDLEVVGLVFDGNIESLAGAYIYTDEVARTVSVDSRGIVESLDDIYDADRLVLELTEGALVETEAEADEVLSAR